MNERPVPRTRLFFEATPLLVTLGLTVVLIAELPASYCGRAIKRVLF